MLLDKINEINAMTNAPKQPCQKIDLKRFCEEMDETNNQDAAGKRAAIRNKTPQVV